MKLNKKLIVLIIFILCLSINCYKIKATDDIISNTQLTYKEIDNQETLISGFDVGTTIGEIVNSYFSSEYEVKIYDTQNIDITSNTQTKIGTGYKIELYKNNEIIKTYRTILYGDTNGDTEINALDALIVVKNKLQLENFKAEAFQEAGRVNNDTRTSSITPSSIDALSIVKYKLMPDKYNISQSIYGTIEEEKENLLLTTKKYEATGDEDGDGLTNAEEERLGTNVYSIDTDMDGLIDSYEIKESKTNPLIADSDGDGINDGDELELGLNPLKADSKDDGVSDGNRTLTYMLEDEDSNISINITGKGNIASTDVQVLENILDENTSKLIDKIYSFSTKGTMDNAIVTIPYTSKEIQEKELNEDNLTLYYLNLENNNLEAVSTSVNKENKTLIATLNHFSSYLIGDTTTRKAIQLNKLIDSNNDGYYDELMLADTGFLPEVNGFSFKNYGSVQSMGGHCYGMAAFVMYYYTRNLPISMEKITIADYDNNVQESIGYDLSNTYFETGNILNDYKITDENLNLIFEQPIDYYSGVENRILKIRDKYYKKLLNIGSTFTYKDTDKYQIQHAYFNENSEEFLKNVKKDDRELFKSIWRLFVTQFETEKSFFNIETNSTYNLLLNNLESGIPSILSLKFKMGNVTAGHAVNAIKIIDDLNSNDKLKIAVYDNNYPNEIRYIYGERKKINFVKYCWENEILEHNSGIYSYEFKYDLNNDGLLEDLTFLGVCDIPIQQIYATLYEDGTLTLSSTNKIVEGKTIEKSYGEISQSLGQPWFYEKEKIISVNVLDTIKPKSLESWFFRL